MRVHLDFETFSSVDLKKHGLARYLAAPDFQVLLTALSLEDGSVLQWEGFPRFLGHLARDPRVHIHAFNAPFERGVMRRYGCEVPLSRWRCTMVHAYSRGFAGQMKDVGSALGIDNAKLDSGTRLIRKFCMPRKPSKNNPATRWTRETAPADWQEFRRYNRVDVLAEREIYHRLQAWPMSPWEREGWEMDQEINDRGVPVDVDMCRAAIATAAAFQARYGQEIEQITGGIKGTQVAELLGWLQERGYRGTDLRAETIRNQLELHQ